jgi:release factor glutamine methyltransferase
MDSLAGKLAGARARLAAAGIAPDEAAIDVDLYARTLLDWDRATLVTEQTGPVPDQLEPVFSSWIERRARHEPSAYIVGYREFYGLRFRVSPAVLIPRPETEFIVEEALPILTALPRPRLADLGTGSGCLAVTLAHEVPSCRVVATDVSRDALEVARLNARRLGVGGRVDFLQTSYLDGVRGPLDLVVANPPYVRELDRRGLSATVRYEPEVALFGGADGLSALAGALDASARALRQGGWLIMEFGYGQEDALADLVAARPGLRLDRVRSDYQQIPRTAVIARR